MHLDAVSPPRLAPVPWASSGEVGGHGLSPIAVQEEGEDMLVPPITGYPVDRTIVQRRRRARKQANRRLSSWTSTRFRRG